AQPPSHERRIDLPGEVERPVRTGAGVDAVDLASLLEGLPQPLGPVRDDGKLRLGRGPGADTDAEPSGLDLFARDLGLPEREDVAGIGRAHRAGFASHVSGGNERGVREVQKGAW